MNIENVKAQMRKGILELCILSILDNGEAYPSDILKDLKESKLIVVGGKYFRSTQKILYANRTQKKFLSRNGKHLGRFTQISTKN